MLSVQSSDVQKLANFDPSGNAGLILACARAAWARRRGEDNERGDRPLSPESTPSPGSPSPTRGRPAMSSLSTAVLSVSPEAARRESDDRAAALSAAGPESPSTAEQREGGDRRGNRPVGRPAVCVGTDERSSSGDEDAEAWSRVVPATVAEAPVNPARTSDDGSGERCRSRSCGNGEGGGGSRRGGADGRAGNDGVGAGSDSEHASRPGEKREGGGVTKREHKGGKGAGARRGGVGSGWGRLAALFSRRGVDA